MVDREGVFGFSTDVIRGSDDETMQLPGRICKASRTEVECQLLIDSGSLHELYLLQFIDFRSRFIYP
jgi:hypothetical protein